MSFPKTKTNLSNKILWIGAVTIISMNFVTTTNPEECFVFDKSHFYNGIGITMMGENPKKYFNKIKIGYEKEVKARDQIPLEYKKEYITAQIDYLSVKELSDKEYQEAFIEIVADELNFDEIPDDLRKTIKNGFKRAKFVQKGIVSWEQIQLSGQFGGKHYLGFGYIGYAKDPKDKDKRYFGTFIYREEWKEESDVAVMVPSHEVPEHKQYITYLTYKKLYDYMSQEVREKINTKEDFHKQVWFPEKNFDCKQLKHIIFGIDVSWSMTSNDNGKSISTHDFGTTGLNNRLGAAYSATQNVIKVRYDNECNDIISTILFNHGARIVAERIPITKDFVKQTLVQTKPDGGTNFGNAFAKIDTTIRFNEDTTVIFLSDGEPNDDYESVVLEKVSNWYKNMGEKLQLYCVVLSDHNSGKQVAKQICDKANGEVKVALDGYELNKIYQDIIYKKIRRKH